MSKKSVYSIIIILILLILGTIFTILFIFGDSTDLIEEGLSEASLADNILIQNAKKEDDLDSLYQSSQGSKVTFVSTDDNNDTALGLTKIVDGPVSYIQTGQRSTDVLYYDPTTGNVRRVNILDPDDSQTLAILKKNVSALSWAPNRKSVIAHYLEGSTYYKLNEGISVPFSTSISKPVFGTDNNIIAYTYFNEESKAGSISIADPMIKAFKNILPTQSKNWRMQWLDNTRISLQNEPRAEYYSESLSVLDTSNNKLNIVLKSKTNLDALWSPNNRYILYSSLFSRNKSIDLRYLNINDQTEMIMPVSTFAYKCVFSPDGNTIYCAVPAQPLKKDTLSSQQDNYFVSIDMSKDEIKYETILNSTSVDVKEILLFPLQNILVFSDERGSGLYRLKISD